MQRRQDTTWRSSTRTIRTCMQAYYIETNTNSQRATGRRRRLQDSCTYLVINKPRIRRLSARKGGKWLELETDKFIRQVYYYTARSGTSMRNTRENILVVIRVKNGMLRRSPWLPLSLLRPQSSCYANMYCTVGPYGALVYP